ncbi:unnamed protein product [Didymodactylos carnosus]|uniref:Uncharacterized protein n=1 Tax=Didymodactylos carnosus TaxID=1234261 RepID=A0A8S2DN91_9BILA|nr:unnamed protein product [Didymodactylos carnosus]CAF3782932.1 unnamed protein product [Didymodactylos carnosus]
MKDITDGRWYLHTANKIQTENNGDTFLSLLMNVDGISIRNKTDSSIWTFTMIIMEITRNKRFRIENVVLGGVALCYRKPTKLLMSVMLDNINKQLKLIQNLNVYYQLKSNENKNDLLRIYLLSSCSDKPATAIIQGIPDPSSFFECSIYEIRGKKSICIIAHQQKQIQMRKTPKANATVRTFSTAQLSEMPSQRCEENYQKYYSLYQKLLNNNELSTDEIRDQTFGYIDRCSFLQLNYFSYCAGFLIDTLHTIYHGVWWEAKFYAW